MALVGELFTLVVYVTQQAGVMLGVGAETVLLVAFLLALREKTDQHDLYVRAARFAQRFGVWVMIISGVGAVAYHVWLGQGAVLFSPAFVFKWILIAVVFLFYAIERATEESGVAVQSVVRGVAGGNWYALFLVHSTAPVLSWSQLLVIYAAWMCAFDIGWAVFVLLMHAPRLKTTVNTPRAAAPRRATPVEPKPVAAPVQPVVRVATTPAPAPVHREPAAVPPVPLHVQAAPAPHAPIHIDPAPAPKPYQPHLVPLRAPQAPTHPLPALAHAELMAGHPMPGPAPHPIHPIAAPRPQKIPSLRPAPAPLASTPEGEGLPAVVIMPQTPEEVSHSERTALVTKFT